MAKFFIDSNFGIPGAIAGNPDKGIDLARPKLGGEAIPFPRRCRTGLQPILVGSPTIIHIVTMFRLDSSKYIVFVVIPSRDQNTISNLVKRLRCIYAAQFPTDINAENRVEKPLPMYVPRDEAFEESKQDTFAARRLRGVLHNLIPSLIASISAG
ncbi:hypothetical protein IFM89_032940 [Coptis chinensis]|uniref:Lipoxygenase domain-containing protein n=1 Tax=Coptis chinensis TaxID=261450 RepID=A0A835I2R2_9MAGN|nr:hypothetical protein IFM89_032940 [Coptis chinensis]